MSIDLTWVADQLGARAVRQRERIQSLWSGYGELIRVDVVDGPAQTAVVKWARPPMRAAGTSMLRKLRSYDVETAFYRQLAPRCDDSCRVAALLAARGGRDKGEWTLVLEDLDACGFDRRADEVDAAQLDAGLAWLASFHARFMGERPAGIWETGTYWHLETRRDELANIADRKLREAAPHLAAQLASARFQTLLHGDAKDANFCFSRDARVAAVDFQYTGPGAGIIDVAYFLYGRSDEPADGIDSARVDRYFAHLRRALHGVDADAVEAEWRALYPVARADFRRFLAGWRR
jgi:hypothetical protein